jgi:hypothetical protein
MDSEPKRSIEKMLEAAAKARRETFGSDPKMPNPMRARLHNEISRIEDGEETRESRGSWLQMFWPRVGVAAAVATLLVIGPLMWWRGANRNGAGMMQVAGRGPGAANETNGTGVSPDQTFAKGPAAASAPAPNVALADNSRAELEPEQTPKPGAADSLEGTKTMGAGTLAPPPVAMKGFISRQEKDVQTEQPPASTTAVAPAPAARAAEARADHSQQPASASMAAKERASTSAEHRPAPGTGATQGVTERFAKQTNGQSFRNNVQSRQTSNILNNFAVQQQGDEIRVVDADGSTYTGRLEPASQFTDHAAARPKRSYASDAKVAEPQSRFRATGYNVSLKKPLVFEGNYTQAAGLEENKSNESHQPIEGQGALRITGTARVHGEPPVEVDATIVTSEVPAGAATKQK